MPFNQAQFNEDIAAINQAGSPTVFRDQLRAAEAGGTVLDDADLRRLATADQQIRIQDPANRGAATSTTPVGSAPENIPLAPGASPPVNPTRQQSNAATAAARAGKVHGVGGELSFFRLSLADTDGSGKRTPSTAPGNFVDFEMAPARRSTVYDKNQAMQTPGAGSGLDMGFQLSLAKLKVPGGRPIYQSMGIAGETISFVGALIGFDEYDGTYETPTHDNVQLAEPQVPLARATPINAYERATRLLALARKGREVVLTLGWSQSGTTADATQIQFAPGIPVTGYLAKIQLAYATDQRVYYSVTIEVTNREDLFLDVPSGTTYYQLPPAIVSAFRARDPRAGENPLTGGLRDSSSGDRNEGQLLRPDEGVDLAYVRDVLLQVGKITVINVPLEGLTNRAAVQAVAGLQRLLDKPAVSIEERVFAGTYQQQIIDSVSAGNRADPKAIEEEKRVRVVRIINSVMQRINAKPLPDASGRPSGDNQANRLITVGSLALSASSLKSGASLISTLREALELGEQSFVGTYIPQNLQPQAEARVTAAVALVERALKQIYSATDTITVQTAKQTYDGLLKMMAYVDEILVSANGRTGSDVAKATRYQNAGADVRTILNTYRKLTDSATQTSYNRPDAVAGLPGGAMALQPSIEQEQTMHAEEDARVASLQAGLAAKALGTPRQADSAPRGGVQLIFPVA